ncbi:hypothetical protein Rsub_09749 [Raphidocelis subcapitata]|uniref:Aminoglycoside phosphotransferase domain-containing protein n=1 Tax=Raphidocelis subcapitata TaxID=307507 RepID=A0A2V0PCW4_9CHLO|nr:hypothetical protein Rsub_09749 [Raphidocelis subcapitata]|eukprot:GBF97691.1 hypothetical protein Rsub_09749 [Raphidocelis subcapitata]
MRHFLHTAPRKGVAWSGRAVGVPPPPQRRARRPRRYAATLAAAPEPASPRQQQQEKRQQEQRQQPARPVLLTCGEEVAAYTAQHPALAAALGGSPDEWRVEEMRGGVINLAWSLERPGGAAVLVKQAPPYVRAVGPSFPLSTERMRVEAAAMRLAHALSPGCVPPPLHYDAANAVLAMPLLPPPHLPLTDALRDGATLPALPRALAALLAALYGASSEAALGPEAHARAVADFANADIVAANEQVVLVGPFTPDDPGNAWLPQLDADVRALWADAAAMSAVRRALGLYRSSREVLIHHDLHGGNILVDPGGDSMWVLDWEFATYGPASYDLGSVSASLLLAAVAAGLGGLPEAAPGARRRQCDWLLGAVVELWEATLEEWWREKQRLAGRDNEQLSSQLSSGEDRAAWAAALLADTLAFTGICMARLVVGMHSYQLFAGLPDQARARVDCERAALRTARRLLAGGGGGRGVRGAVAIAAEEIAALASKPAD